MSEKDLGLKAASRRLLWLMGYSTRVDVPLRVFVPTERGGTSTRQRTSQHESLTDLDVLGVHVSADLRVQTAIADCKTTARGSTERMFWIRGVADFFAADDAYMVRSNDVTAASRQLATKLGVAVLTPPDLSALEGHYGPAEAAPLEKIEFLFDPARIAAYRHAFTQLDRRLQALREYQEFDFWVYDEHRNLLQSVAHLSDAATVLDPANPVHRAVFFESAWLYALSLMRAAHHVRRTHVSDIDTSLREYLFGGQLGLREKRQLAKVLRTVAGKASADPDDGVFPAYFDPLLELTRRFLRRPSQATIVLRYAEWAAESQMNRDTPPAADIFDTQFDDIAAKLLGDVCGFLVTTAGLHQDFRTYARSLLAPDARHAPATRVEGSSRPTRKLPASSQPRLLPDDPPEPGTT